VYDRLKGLYAITDETLTPDQTLLTQVEIALEAGVRIIQYRNKSASDDEVESRCRQLQFLCREHKALFIIDDRPRLAQRIGADGLHIGKDDMALSEARKIFPKGIIGVSCYGSVRKALEAEAQGADYVAFGSFFPSPTKPRSGIVSLDVIDKAKAALKLPVCVIGGIDSTNIYQVAARGPDMVSVVSGIFKGDIKDNVTRLKKGMDIR